MLFLGIEVDVHQSRAVVLDLASAEIAIEASAPHPWIEGLPDGHREQDPACWINAVNQCIGQCTAALGEKRNNIQAISVSGNMQGIVALDAAKNIIRPAKLLGDVCTQRQATEISRAFGGTPGMLEMIGNPLLAESAAAFCLWLKYHEPYHFQRTQRILSTKDFLNFWLTGEAVTEPSWASGSGMFDIYHRTWRPKICCYIDNRLQSILPSVQPALSPIGYLRKNLADSWGFSHSVLVTAGACSQMLSSMAAGCVTSGSVALELSTPTYLTGISATPRVDLLGEISTFCDVSGQWQSSVQTANAIMAPEMMRRHYGCSHQQIEQMISVAPPGADGLLFLPYINGEKTPKLPEASGVIHGITLANFTPQNVVRATMEGVCCGIGYGYERMRELGFEPPEIHITGTGASSHQTRQLLADVIGLPVVGISSPQGAAFGAAIHAAIVYFRHNGEAINWQEMAKYLVKVDEFSRCEPNTTQHGFYQQLLSRQQYLVETLHSSGFL